MLFRIENRYGLKISEPHIRRLKENHLEGLKNAVHWKVEETPTHMTIGVFVNF